MDGAELTHVCSHQTPIEVEILYDISYQEFFETFLLLNKPCLLRGIINDWRSVREWVTPDGKPNFQFLSHHFGDAMVPVADCKREQYQSQPKEDMLLNDFINYWLKYIKTDYNNEDRCLYLKDWHFKRAFPNYEAYTTPIYFSSDWLNEFWDTRQGDSDDYRFVYMGPKGSWTPLHADVFHSFSWSANICGRKQWLMYPPGQEMYLHDNHGNLAYDVTSTEMHDGKKFPKYCQLKRHFEVIQEAGDVLFVPSGWHHQVLNLEDTISINHNWLNGCNINIVWNFLKSELVGVQRSISDCREMENWEQQCQLIMAANTGIDYPEFSQLLCTIAKARLLDISRIRYEARACCKVCTHERNDECKNNTCKHVSIIGDDVLHWKDAGRIHESNASGLEVKVLNKTEINYCRFKDQTQASTGYRNSSCDRLRKADILEVETFENDKGQVNDISDKYLREDSDDETKPKIDCLRCLQPNNPHHIMFDLQRLKDVIYNLLMEPAFMCVNPQRLITNPVEILDKVKKALTEVENSGLFGQI